jgi:hypothetical protein
MRSGFYIITILLFLLTSFNKKEFETTSLARWVIERNSSINIQGETNINTFKCDVTEYLRPDTLFYSTNDVSKKMNFTNSCLAVEVKRFDCHNKFMTEDFRSALKADENPTLKIIFISVDQFPVICDNQQVTGIVDIQLARVTKRIEIVYSVKTLSANHVQLSGSHVFTFSDFNLKAPKKLAGLIRTKNEIKVNFQLFFKTV